MSDTERTLLVTGASGNIGRSFRAFLDSRGVNAVYLVSPRHAGQGDSVRSVDIADRAAMHEVIAEVRPDAIVHLASLVGAACESDPQLAAAVNVEAVRGIADAAARFGVRRVVLASTAAVYGDAFDSPARESDPTPAPSVYAATKLEAEGLLAAAAAASLGLSAVSLRIFNVFGSGLSGSLVTRLSTSSADAPVRLDGLDGFVRDYIHVDDVAAALLAAADAPLPASYAVVNVASGIAMTNGELAEAIRRSQPVFVEVGQERRSYSVADVTAARELLGFTASRAVGS